MLIPTGDWSQLKVRIKDPDAITFHNSYCNLNDAIQANSTALVNILETTPFTNAGKINLEYEDFKNTPTPERRSSKLLTTSPELSLDPEINTSDLLITMQL